MDDEVDKAEKGKVSATDEHEYHDVLQPTDEPREKTPSTSTNGDTHFHKTTDIYPRTIISPHPSTIS